VKDVCGCDEAKRLQAELAIVTAERDYMLTGLDPSEVRVMRQELAKEHEHGEEDARAEQRRKER
jgi:hypothetical protein